jgi:cellulose synthase/poly-beta-1,6-N-acetylglucosamine synthase-like glycosyltransferase
MSQPGSARDGVSGRHALLIAAFLSGAAGLAIASGDPLFVAGAMLSPFFLLQALYMLGAALERPSIAAATSDDDGVEWPDYTVLAPLYREAGMVPGLIEALDALDYPRDRLQVLILIEADDDETAQALAETPLPAAFRVVVVPAGGPRTKPNALNHGLALAAGSLITVYDAEDAPDPAQIRDAARLFRTLPPEVVCLQARLVIDNASDGWLPLMMAIEYAGLFDATKCGFAAMAIPVALGGTSNHFRADALRSVGGWDAWNVAEDADMGLRIARANGRIADLASATWEEAPVHLGGWFAQRRRWHKGFLQTTFTHMRGTRAAISAVGLFGWLGGMAQIAGSLLGALLYPLFAAHLAWLAATGALFDNADLKSALRNTMALWVASCGTLAVLAPAIIGLRRRRAWHFAPWLLTLPFYQLLISGAAYVALVDYVRAPSRWLKTDHAGGSRRPAAGIRSRPEWRS